MWRRDLRDIYLIYIIAILIGNGRVSGEYIASLLYHLVLCHKCQGNLLKGRITMVITA